jgi:hypothetical protein
MILQGDTIGVQVAAEAPAPVQFAGEELSRYLSIILDAVVRVDATGAIVLAIDESGDLGEGYRYRASGAALSIEGGTARAVLYGVYAFLRDICGCRFSAPGADSEYVPRRQAIVVPDGSVERRPRLWYRGLQFSYVASPQAYLRALDWMPKIGLNYVMTMMGHPSSAGAQRTTVDPRTGETKHGSTNTCARTWRSAGCCRT